MSEEARRRWSLAQAMGQISGPIIRVTLGLVSVFVPLAFFSGSIGNIYRHSPRRWSLIALSAFLALSSPGPVRDTAQAWSRPGITTRKKVSSAGSIAASPARPKAMRAGLPAC